MSAIIKLVTDEQRASLRARVVAKVERAWRRLFIRGVDAPEPVYMLPDETFSEFRARVKKSLEDRR